MPFLQTNCNATKRVRKAETHFFDCGGFGSFPRFENPTDITSGQFDYVIIAGNFRFEVDRK